MFPGRPSTEKTRQIYQDREVTNPIEPRVTGFAVVSSEISQCRPVRMSFVVTNETGKPIYSQRPYIGATYNLYHTFRDKGIELLSDRYMVGISLNGGLDGYPYRWGFRGPLAPGRSVNMMGFLSLIEVGTYKLTASMLLGDTPIGPTNSATVSVQTCEPIKNPDGPTPGEPIYPIVNGKRLPRMTPFIQDGYLMLAVRPLVHSIGGNLYLSRTRLSSASPAWRWRCSPRISKSW